MDSIDGFLGRIREKIEALNFKETDLLQQLDDVKRAKDRYQAAWEIYQDEMGDEARAVTAPGRIPDAELVQMTIADASAALMREAGGAARVTDIVRRLRVSGKTKAKGTGAYATVIKTLQRNPERFYRVDTGKWGLMEMKEKVPGRHLL